MLTFDNPCEEDTSLKLTPVASFLANAVRDSDLVLLLLENHFQPWL